MAKKGNVRHIKSLSSPTYLNVHKKEYKYTAKAMPGRHSLERGIPLISFGRKIGISDSSKYIKRVINTGGIAVNGKTIKQPYYTVGLNDVVDMKDAGKSYIIGINDRAQIDIKEGKEKPARVCKVVQKYKTKGNSLMIRLHDGEVFKAKDKGIGVNDSIMIKGTDPSEGKRLKLDVGCKCLIIDGVHVGDLGIVEGIQKGSDVSKATARIKSGSGAAFDTLLDNIMVVE
jgi:ribosomal protein S4E